MSLKNSFCVSRKEEVGWYTQRVETAWLCLGLALKILQYSVISFTLSANGPRKQSFYKLDYKCA